MSVDEARKILSVPPNATRLQINTAVASLRWKYVTQSQYATDTHERDVACVALAKIQEAHRVLAKVPTSTPIKPPPTASTSAAAGIPRISLGGAGRAPRPTSRAPVSTAATKPRSRAPTPGRAPHPTTAGSPGQARPTAFREKIAAVLICLAMFILALALLAGAWR